MAVYLSIPMKTTWEVDVVKPLKTFIQARFEGSSLTEDDYKTSLVEFQKLRNNMITKSGDKHESALEVLYRYFDQLCAIESKLPITENQIRIDFKWQDAFDKESFWSGKRTLKIPSGGYEKVCVLFNIAALQTGVAQSYNLSSDDGLKSAARMYQQAGGIFSSLKDSVMSHLQNDPTPDLHPDTLGALSALVVAQAQDCFYRKAVNDKMKPAIVAKVAAQCSDLYGAALKLMQLQSLRDLWPKDWIPHVSAKESSMQGLAEFHQSEVHRDSKEFGEQIARLRAARELLSGAETRGGSAFIHTDEARRIARLLEDAEKDNNFIYHAKVPEKNRLPSIAKAALAKPLPVNSPMSKDFTDIFAKIVPITVHNAIVNFDNMKAAVINQEVGRLREATQVMNSILASLNLPAAIEDFGGESVPPSVLEKAEKVRSEGGIAVIAASMQELPELLRRNKDILDEAVSALEDEEKSDNQLREQFKEKWTRTPSNKLTEPMKTEGIKYRSIIDNAIQADKVVQQRYTEHKQNMELLSKSDSEISKSIPAASPAANLKNSPAVKELANLIEEVNTIKAERDTLEVDIKDATFDMSAAFMGALTADGIISNEQLLSEQKLDEKYTPLRAIVNESLAKQESLLQKIQTANSQFCQAKSQNQTARKREDVLKDLASAYDRFMELKSNLAEGTKFYNDLTQLLVKFQSKVNDFCFARKTEKEELMKDVQQSIATRSTAPPPPAPSYHQQQDTTRTPPERPPPPQFPPAPAAAPGVIYSILIVNFVF